MKVQVQKPLFAWDCLEDFPALATIRDLLEAIPDGMLLQGLKTARGRGRNDYPVRSLWGVVVLTVALRHTGFEACLGELRRNPALAKLIGIESKEDIPKAWNVSRFLDVPGEEPTGRNCRPSSTAWSSGWARWSPTWESTRREMRPR